jgi:hypothetical protein
MKKITLSLVIFMTMYSSVASADSNERKIGANAGAMKFCKDKVADKRNRAKYAVLQTRAVGEYDDLDSNERAKALVWRNKAEKKGDYLGSPLNARKCEEIRKILTIRYK